MIWKHFQPFQISETGDQMSQCLQLFFPVGNTRNYNVAYNHRYPRRLQCSGKLQHRSLILSCQLPVAFRKAVFNIQQNQIRNRKQLLKLFFS